MSFVATSQSFWLENGHILHAQCRDTDGSWKDSTIDLNQFIGNSDGWFVWDGANFSRSAQNISLDGPMLSAELTTHDGGHRERQGLNLNDRISNNNGQLAYNRQT
ncbi:CVNH domain-containing protein [Pochonia chlamydosporia 170]|uniref:CVNH domain-containing protein n=1 Tax=Pochonia chlamydosporia 170 TaxID=1380566 RepID=A0A179EYR6_METCM|nr:CVNH domain-containing protein [Pochonia chlamydosporia 170]OAQ58302.1 CVNH domain-containing protein [Pochonia chlamydosporia 170]